MNGGGACMWTISGIDLLIHVFEMQGFGMFGEETNELISTKTMHNTKEQEQQDL